ncbi:MAG: Na+/H+ antiporter NhaA [Steroidobacteraceae bacterium]
MKPDKAEVPAAHWLVSLQDFLRLEAAGGLLLMIAAVVALLVANSPLAAAYAAFLDLPVQFGFGGFLLAKPLLLWINDGLMAVFFFLVGMELKRELLEGHLSSWRRAALPAIAAVGGMLAPALLYIALNRGDAVALRGWAIPTATDIAFALGVLALLGPRVPTALKAFLLSIAIFDDLGAIVVIAVFYTASLSLLALGVALLMIIVLAVLNRRGVQRPAAYVLAGIVLWVAVLKSGVHATLAGVVLAMFIPLRSGPRESSLLRHLEHALHPWVAFAILPLFAFANAGVSLAGMSLTTALHPVPLGVVLGLFLGKQAGIMAASLLAVRARFAALPEGVSWTQLYGAALLCGIGFTMSLFIAQLAMPPGAGLERFGVLLGTLLSGVAGYAVLRLVLPQSVARN